MGACSVALTLALAIAAPAVASYLPAPDAVPAGLEGSCRAGLEARRQSLETEQAFIDPQIEFHEGMCGSVDPQDSDQMNDCAISEADLGPQIEAYFKLIGPYLIEVGAIRTRLEDIQPERDRLEAALARKRAELAGLDARFEFHGDEINRALSRLSGGADRIGEWRAMTIEAQKKALYEAFFVVADYVLGRMKITNAETSQVVTRRLEDVDAILRRYGAYPMAVEGQALLTRTLAGVSRDHDVLTYTKAAKNAVKLWIIEDIPYDGVKKVVLALSDVIRMIAPFQLQLAIGGSKFGAAYLYAIGATITAEASVDLESEQMAIHLRAIDANQTSREAIMEERLAARAGIEALGGERAALPTGCPEPE